MNHYVKIAFALCACIALTSAQYGHYYPDFSTSFGAPNQYTAYSSSTRDPRANPGPVVFPPSPSSDPGQTSGVVVGASGYGFVPPTSRGPAIPRFYYRSFYAGR